jgi:hypothetical protein
LELSNPEGSEQQVIGDEVMALYLPDVQLSIKRERALYDFTAVGDVVNTASRLQGQAAGGEILLSDRVVNGLPRSVGTREELILKGKSEPQVAYGVSAWAPIRTAAEHFVVAATRKDVPGSGRKAHPRVGPSLFTYPLQPGTGSLAPGPVP